MVLQTLIDIAILVAPVGLLIGICFLVRPTAPFKQSRLDEIRSGIDDVFQECAQGICIGIFFIAWAICTILAWPLGLFLGWIAGFIAAFAAVLALFTLAWMIYAMCALGYQSVRFLFWISRSISKRRMVS